MGNDNRSDAEHQTPRSTWKFGGDQVTQVTAALDEKAREIARWFFAYCVEADISITDAGERIGYDKSVLYRFYNGKYSGSVENVIGAMGKFRGEIERTGGVGHAGFVETSLSKKIWKICDSAIVYESISFIYGDSHIGKTWALEEYKARNNHGRTIYMRMPATAGHQLMLKELAVACDFSAKAPFEKLRSRVMSSLDRDKLLIVDEIHQTFISYLKSSRLTCLELLREIHDRTGCGMVLCGTNVFKEELQGGHHKELLEQLRRRGIFELQLPAHAPKRDLQKIADSYGLGTFTDDAWELASYINRTSGLKRYATFLRVGQKLANNRKQNFTWDHFITAHDAISDLSTNHE